MPSSARLSELSLFTKQTSVMLDSGLGLVQSLEAYAKGGGPLVEEVLEIVKGLEAGCSLSKALSKYPDAFNAAFVTTVRVAERSGRLSATFSQLSVLLERQLERRRKLIATLSYPVILILGSVMALLGLLYGVLPLILPALQEADRRPIATQVLLAIKEALPFTTSLVFVFITIFLVMRSRRRDIFKEYPKVQRWVHGLPLKIPMFSKAAIKLVSVNVLSNVALLLDSGTPIIPALRTAADTSGNAEMSIRINRAVKLVEAGTLVPDALRQSEALPNDAIEMLTVGIESGTMTEMFRYVAAAYDRDTEVLLEDLFVLIEPLLLSVIGLVVGFFAVGAITPIIQMTQTM